MLDPYTEQLKKQPVLSALPFDRWPEVIREAQNWGLLSPEPDIPSFLRLQPTLTYFLRNRLHESKQEEVKQAIETAFREHYDQLGGMLNQLLQSKDPREKQVGQLLTGLEYENLVMALQLAQTQQVSFYTIFFTLSLYLKAIPDDRRGLELGEMALARMHLYPPDKLTSVLGLEFGGVIDDIATRHLNLKQYAAAESLFQQALKILLENDLYNANNSTLRMNSALTYHRLGRVAEEQQQWPQAEQYYQQALQIKIEFDDRYSQARTYHQLGMVAEEQRQWQQAEQYYQQALEIFCEYEDNYTTSIVLRSFARLWKDSHVDSVPKTVASILGLSEGEATNLLTQALQ